MIILIAQIEGTKTPKQNCSRLVFCWRNRKCSDLGITDRLFIDGTGPSKEMIINGTNVAVYWGLDNVKGTVLVMVDEIHNMVITM